MGSDETVLLRRVRIPEVHAGVSVVECAEGRFLLACSVRYRQLPAGLGSRVPAIPLTQE